MTAKNTTTKSERKTFIPAKKTGTRGSALKDVRTIVGHESGQANFVLVFDDAEVVMPGTWTIREDQFPDGIYEGQLLAAYWEQDAEGVNRFHLYEVEAAA